MISLGVDTSNAQASLCLLRDTEVLSEQTWLKQGSHSELITDKFLLALRQAKISLEDIEVIYCSVGPGSFTGIRVGVSFSKALAYSYNLPVIPVNSLQALALSTDYHGDIICLIDGQKNSFFFSQFIKCNHSLKSLVENRLIDIKELKTFISKKIICCGDGYPRYKNFMNDDIKNLIHFDEQTTFIKISKVIQWNQQSQVLQTLPWPRLQALYIRASAAEEKLLEKASSPKS